MKTIQLNQQQEQVLQLLKRLEYVANKDYAARIKEFLKNSWTVQLKSVESKKKSSDRSSELFSIFKTKRFLDVF